MIVYEVSPGTRRESVFSHFSFPRFPLPNFQRPRWLHAMPASNCRRRGRNVASPRDSLLLWLGLGLGHVHEVDSVDWCVCVYRRAEWYRRTRRRRCATSVAGSTTSTSTTTPTPVTTTQPSFSPGSPHTPVTINLLYWPSERSETGGYIVFTFVCLCVCVCAHSVQSSTVCVPPTTHQPSPSWRIYALSERLLVSYSELFTPL